MLPSSSSVSTPVNIPEQHTCTGADPSSNRSAFILSELAGVIAANWRLQRESSVVRIARI